MPLDYSFSTLTPDERVAEKDRILDMLKSNSEEDFSRNEWTFICDMESAQSCSPKQLLWLRNIKDKYL
jgi:hypothetical protein